MSRRGRQTSRARLLAAVLAASALVAAAGCGGGSGKPAYCSDRSKLESSIKGLTGVSLSGGLSGVEAQLRTIQSDATALVASARSDFPTQTSAIQSSITALENAVRTLPSSPSATQIATIATDAANVVSAVKSFTDATSSKCD